MADKDKPGPEEGWTSPLDELVPDYRATEAETDLHFQHVDVALAELITLARNHQLQIPSQTEQARHDDGSYSSLKLIGRYSEMPEADPDKPRLGYLELLASTRVDLANPALAEDRGEIIDNLQTTLTWLLGHVDDDTEARAWASLANDFLPDSQPIDIEETLEDRMIKGAVEDAARSMKINTLNETKVLRNTAMSLLGEHAGRVFDIADHVVAVSIDALRHNPDVDEEIFDTLLARDIQLMRTHFGLEQQLDDETFHHVFAVVESMILYAVSHHDYHPKRHLPSRKTDPNT